MRALALPLLLTIAAIAPADGQTLGTTASPPPPSGVVSGVVVDAVTRAPVRSATVRIGLADGFGFSKIAATDQEGRFEITSLPGGTYVLSATSPNHLESTLGQRQPGAPATPLTIADGETRGELIITMWRGGIISGRVLDDYGDPVPGIQVFAVRSSAGATRPFGGAWPGRTDDRGAYRLFMLEPDVYVVFAQQPTANAIGASERAGPVSTYFPRTTDAARAERITVTAGREVPDVEIVLASATLSRVRGRVVASNGPSHVGATVLARALGSGPLAPPASAAIGPDGAFELTLAAGRYVLVAGRRDLGAGDDGEIGRTEIVVKGENLDDILINAARGSVLRGAVVTDTGEPIPMMPRQLSVRLVPSDDDRGGARAPVGVSDDYSFEVRSLAGRLRLELDTVGMLSQWAVKMIRWRGEDVTYTPFEFNGDVIDEVEIVLSDRWATLSGVARGDGNAASRDVSLLLFPVDEALRIPNSRYVRFFLSDSQGRFGISWLPGGEYFLARAPKAQPGQWTDSAFLRALADGAVRVTLVEGEEHEIDLRVPR